MPPGLEPGALGVQPLHGFACVGLERALSIHVLLDLDEAGIVLPLVSQHPLFLGLQAVAGHRQAMKPGRRFGFRLTESGQAQGLLGLRRGGLRGLSRQLGDPFFRLRKPRFCLVGLDGRRRPAQVQNDRLGLTDAGADVSVARGLPDLPLEALELGLERRHHVVEPGQVQLRRAQAQLRLVAARMEAGDPGRLLQQRPPVGGLGVDHGVDLALADQPRRVGAGERIGEKKLHVPGPDLTPVDPVAGTPAALDAAGHLDLVRVVELRRGPALGVVEVERHLGQIARRPVDGAGEDDVVHLAAAHAFRRCLSHHPAQRFGHVRLAAAVGADDAGEPGLEVQLGRFDERLEAC